MNRNELTSVELLKTGDRFYKASDKNKLVFVIVEGERKQTHFRTYKYFACPASIVDHQGLKQVQKERSYKAVNKDTQVVFLRHAEELTQAF